MGQPDGGWYDDDPPVVVGSSPEDRATNIKTKKITIYFDEFIKIDNPSEKVIVSPPQLETPEIKAAGKKIVVELKDTLKENTTYTIDFSDAISDNNEGNPMGNYFRTRFIRLILRRPSSRALLPVTQSSPFRPDWIPPSILLTKNSSASPGAKSPTTNPLLNLNSSSKKP